MLRPEASSPDPGLMHALPGRSETEPYRLSGVGKRLSGTTICGLG